MAIPMKCAAGLVAAALAAAAGVAACEKTPTRPGPVVNGGTPSTTRVEIQAPRSIAPGATARGSGVSSEMERCAL